MEKIDWKYVNEVGCNLFFTSFQPILRFGLANVEKKRSKYIWLPLVPAIEERFEYLIAECETKLGEETLNSILEIPTSMGWTCLMAASMFSEKLTNFLLKMRLPINSISLCNEVAHFKFSQHAAEMMSRGLNPKVIQHDDKNSLEKFEDTFADTQLMELANSFTDPISIHFTTQDINCDTTGCPPNCSSKFKKFYYKDGSFVTMTADNKIGSGGFGMVYKGMFHGQAKAMKIIPIEIKFNLIIKDAVSELENNIAEYRMQLSTAGSGVIIPEAFVRQQNQEKSNGKWIAKNYNIFIYPLYDCNLDELHDKYFDKLKEEILADIIDKCFIRNGQHQLPLFFD